MKTQDSILAAEYLLAIGNKMGHALNVTQIQKLLYIAYGLGFIRHDLPIVNESPKAWPYGPVFPRARDKAAYSTKHDCTDTKFKDIEDDSEAKCILEYVVDKFGKFPAGRLSAWSHNKDGAWDITTKKEGFQWNTPIDDTLIKEYFSKLKFS